MRSLFLCETTMLSESSLGAVYEKLNLVSGLVVRLNSKTQVIEVKRRSKVSSLMRIQCGRSCEVVKNAGKLEASDSATVEICIP